MVQIMCCTFKRKMIRGVRMSLVVILNNQRDKVVANDKRIIHTKNEIVTYVDDSSKKIFITPQNYVVTFCGDIRNDCISVPDLLCDFVTKTKENISIEGYIKTLRDFVNNFFVQQKLVPLNAKIQVSGINNYPITKGLNLENMEIVDYNRQFILCGSIDTASEEVQKICNSPEYKNGELNMTISYMETLARDLIKISSQKEVGKYGVCPVSQTCDIVRIVYKKL